MTVPDRADVERWSPQDRAQVARLLDQFVDRPGARSRPPRQRTLLLVVTCVGAVALLPWIAFLAASLPRSHSVTTWNVTWVGFDVVLAACFGVTGWLLLHRRRMAILGLGVTATLLSCDAWFDVSLGWGSSEQLWALVSAALFEVPIAVLMVAGVIRLLRRESAVVAQLRGRPGPRGSIWEQTFVMLAPEAADWSDGSGPS
ncbi:MAG: hypothetical protein KGQ66_21575 [Acidobacteriota bacterium]|nr:hypothetical protein [Acidobacteriota bacterium]